MKLPSPNELDPKTILPLAQQWEEWRANVGESDDLAAIFDALPQSLRKVYATLLLHWSWRNRLTTPDMLRRVLLHGLKVRCRIGR